MSHTPNHKDTEATSAFYQGMEAGQKNERERILNILQQAPHLLTSGLLEQIQSNFEPDPSNYERGLSDAGDALHEVLDRLKSSLYDTEYLTDADTSLGQKLLEIIYDRYGETIWKKRDGE